MLRRHAWRWLTIALIATFASAIAAPTASALEPPPITPAAAPLTHKGWTYLNLNYCAPGMMCTAIYRESMGAWRWHTAKPTCTEAEMTRDRGCWRSASLSQGWVYVYPYSGSWRWAWTQTTGWLAVSGGRFELRGY